MTLPITIPLPTPFPVGDVNTFLFLEPELTLVDCGQDAAGAYKVLSAELHAHNLTVADLKKVIITHAHLDHIGLAARICEESDAQVLVNPMTYQWAVEFEPGWADRMVLIDGILAQCGVDEGYRKGVNRYFEWIGSLWRNIPAERVAVYPLDQPLLFGGMAWDVIEAGGHTSTQTCFYQRETRQLISADCLLPKSPVPVMERNATTGQRIPGLAEHLKSIERLYALEVDYIHAGHGVIEVDHRTLITKQKERILTRTAECLTLVQQGNSTVYGLVEIMYAHFGLQSRYTGIGMVLGYLDVLLADGKVTQAERDGVMHYSAI